MGSIVMNGQRIERGVDSAPQRTELRDKIALMLSLTGFGALAGVFSSGAWLEMRPTLAAVLIFLALQAGAVLLGTLTRHRSLGRAALILSALSFGGGIILAVGLVAFFVVGRLTEQEPPALQQSHMPAPVRADNSSPEAGLAITTTATRKVIVNSVKLSDHQVAQLEQTYGGAEIPNGEYWYDRISGAWGQRGGPVAGRLMAGLSLGAALRRDASNGNTGVVVNGRELHLTEVMALSQLGPVLPGRYWLDASGNYGYEGGSRMGNLYAAAAPADGGDVQKGSALTTWDRVGAKVY
jgi:hypothetical protein